MNVLITHECSGAVREACRAEGHDAWSCDQKPAEDGSPFHIQGDALRVITDKEYLDLLGMHPECRFLNGAGLHWNDRGRGWDKTEDAYRHVMECVALANASGANWYLENSIGILSTRWRKPDQIVQPYQFGDDASKATCFWTCGLPRLEPLPKDQWAQPRIVNGRPRWSNQTDTGQNRLSPGPNRSADRARTYPGIAKAIAQQWASL